jgi:3D (Asp-Asp-Asp) domain-containing protein
MKPLIGVIGLALLLAPPAFARGRTTQEQPQQSLLARVTVYWASGGRGSDWYTRRHKCATGVRLRVGHCAVDPRRIPYGSKVVLPDGVFTAVDTGGAVKNRKAARRSGRTASERNALVIDRFFETKRQALSWANAHPEFMTVQVIPPNYYRAATAQPRKLPAQVSKQPAPQVAAGTVPQTKRIASASLSGSGPFGRMRR